MQLAASKGILLEVDRLVAGPIKDTGASIDESDDVKRTPLMFAAMEGSGAVIDALIDAGAAVNFQSVSDACAERRLDVGCCKLNLA